jgi:hypothetical protein
MASRPALPSKQTLELLLHPNWLLLLLLLLGDGRHSKTRERENLD